MPLAFTRFRWEDYAEYASWFADAELNHQLGPMDQEWLDAVLAEPESAGATWAVFRDAELVAVVETVFSPQNNRVAAIMAIATKPALRRRGIGTAVLQQVLLLHESQGIVEHVAYIAADNHAGQRCAGKVGFVSSDAAPNEHGYLEFRHRQQTAPYQASADTVL